MYVVLLTNITSVINVSAPVQSLWIKQIRKTLFELLFAGLLGRGVLLVLKSDVSAPPSEATFRVRNNWHGVRQLHTSAEVDTCVPDSSRPWPNSPANNNSHNLTPVVKT